MPKTQADRLYLALNATETTETKIGTFTAPSTGVSRIIAVQGAIQQPTGTNGELVSGYFKLVPSTTSGTFKFPAQTNIGQGAVGATVAGQNSWIPVDIPFPPNEKIDVYMAADVAVTGTATGAVSIIFE